MGKGKRVDVYLEVKKRRVIYFLNETSACATIPPISTKGTTLSHLKPLNTKMTMTHRQKPRAWHGTWKEKPDGLKLDNKIPIKNNLNHFGGEGGSYFGSLRIL